MMAEEPTANQEFTARQYRALIEQTSDVITLVDADGTVTYQSPSSEQVKGWTQAEMVGENILEYVHPDDRPWVSERFSALTEETGTIEDEIEFRFRTKDDGWIWLAVTGTALDPDSPLDGYVTTSREITTRKQVEKQLTEERNFLDTLVESLPYPFYVLDTEDYTIVHANSRATVTEGDTCYEVTHGRDQPCDQGPETAPCPIHEVEVDEPATVQHVHQDEDGNDRIYELHAAPISDDDGNVVQIAESNIDITDRVAYERQLETQRDNLELLNQIVRHDIRNDIQIISAYAEAVSEYVEDGGTEHVAKIRDAARDAIDITETARDVTEVMIQSDAELSPTDLRSVLEAEANAVRANYEQAVVTIDGSIPAVDVRADDMLEAVFRNLLNNAVQHNDAEIPEVAVSATLEDDVVRVSVADNGPGVPDDQKADIFDKGEQGLESTGSGLGLYLVETLVERYGGRISVDDNEPRGAVFTVVLPVAD